MGHHLPTQGGQRRLHIPPLVLYLRLNRGGCQITRPNHHLFRQRSRIDSLYRQYTKLLGPNLVGHMRPLCRHLYRLNHTYHTRNPKPLQHHDHTRLLTMRRTQRRLRLPNLDNHPHHSLFICNQIPSHGQSPQRIASQKGLDTRL
jgi:hypothetical protein